MSASPSPSSLPAEMGFPHLTIWTVRLGAPEQVALDAACLYTFAEALPGLPQSHRFALISDENYAPLQWLQSLDEWTICLPVLSLDAVELDGYAARVGEASELDAACARIMLVTHLGAPSFAVNLLAPIVLDGHAGTGKQLILDLSGGEHGAPVGTSSGARYALRQSITWDTQARRFKPSC